MSRLSWAEISDPEFKWVTIDPGDKNVGVALWSGQVCEQSTHQSPWETVLWLQSTARPHQLIGFERFVLDPRRARIQGGSELLTSQMIGQIHLIALNRGIPTAGYTNTQGKVCYKIKPWTSWPVRRWASYGNGGHAKDAEVAGYSFMRTIRKQEKRTDASWEEVR